MPPKQTQLNLTLKATYQKLLIFSPSLSLCLPAEVVFTNDVGHILIWLVVARNENDSRIARREQEEERISTNMK